MLNNFNN